MNNKETAPIRSFFGEHARRLSFHGPVNAISLKQRIDKQTNGMESTKEEVLKILTCLIESNFPHKNVEEAASLIEKIIEKEINLSVEDVEKYCMKKKTVFFERAPNTDGSWDYYEVFPPSKFNWWKAPGSAPPEYYDYQ
jgi:hypothetical protein